MNRQFFALVATTALTFGAPMAFAASAGIDADDIGGKVTGAKGPEAGVWVIAETSDTPTRYIKIVVTNDDGRYVLPDLPKGKYKVWVRGYGLVDSKPVEATPGNMVDLKAVAAPDAKAAAQIYPANYWFALMKVPEASEFPGTGPKGNGIAPLLGTQQRWTNALKACTLCHEMGTKITREMPDPSVENWYQRLKQARPHGDPSIGNNGRGYSNFMVNGMTAFGARGVNMWTDWTQRIAKGELPTEAPPRPSGIERNIVLTLWDWADGSYLHDASSSDRRDATRNANGPVYGIASNIGKIAVLDPNTNKTSMIQIPDSATRYPHTLMFDGTSKVWVTDIEQSHQPDVKPDARAAFCTDEGSNKFAKYWPSPGNGRHVHVYDIKTGNVENIETCFGTHHLNLARDDHNTMYFSNAGTAGDLVGWVDTKVWQETHDAEKAQGWCPFVVDTNNDGKISTNRADWNQPKRGLNRGEGEDNYAGRNPDAPVPSPVVWDNIDPKKDTRVIPGTYGIENNPVDNSIWFASAGYPGTLIRFDRGANPPETCKTEIYNAPKAADGKFQAYLLRGVSFDSQGVAWASFGSGQLGSFDRRKCKTLAGPTALGDHCPEGWTILNPPNVPSFAGLKGDPTASTDFFYQSWVDLQNSLGLGKDVPVVPGSNSDALWAYLPASKKWVTLRVPYPLGFNTRWTDGRIDDANTGWKGRGAWATYSNVPVWHEEGGTDTSAQLVKFQVRPDPLAH